MTTEYEPGRIYSGVYGGRRRNALYSKSRRFYFVNDEGYQHAEDADEFIDVRGPLVVLDLDGTYTPGLVTALRNGCFNHVADQIEEQTKPPLQIGWHEAKDEDDGPREVLRWDGSRFCWPIGHAVRGNWTSTYFIGKGSGDE